MASALRHSASVSAGSGGPAPPMAAPPISASSNPKVPPARLPTARNTRTASGVTSCPIPSPGSTAILWVAMPSFPRSDAAGVLRALPARQHAVECALVRAGARLDDVGRGALPGDQRAVEIDLHRHLAEGVLAGGRGADGVILRAALHAGDRVEGREGGVHRAVADARVLVRLAVLLELHRCRRDHARAADDVQVLELVHGVRLRRLVGDDGDQVLVVDLLLAVGEVLESLERAVEIAGHEVEAEVLEPCRQRVPPGVLAEDDLVGRPADVLRLHALVGELVAR